MIDAHEHQRRIEALRELGRIAGEMGPELPALLEYLDQIEEQGIVMLVPASKILHTAVPRLADALVNRYQLPEDLRLSLDEERDLARAFSDFAKVAIRVAKRHEERQGRTVEEWARLLASTARST